MPVMTEFDLAAAALLIVFGYGGYRRGLIVFTLHLAGGVLAFALAALVAPLVAPYVTEYLKLPGGLAQPLIIVGLTMALRTVFGYAVRELAAALKSLVHAVPPLRLLDRVLGIAPGLALGAVFVLALTLAAINLPLGRALHEAATESWVARTVLARPEEAWTTLGRWWESLVAAPPRLGVAPLAAGVGGLWCGAFAAMRLRPRPSEPAALDELTTRRVARPGSLAAEAADPLAWARMLMGLGAAAGMMALLLALATLR